MGTDILILLITGSRDHPSREYVWHKLDQAVADAGNPRSVLLKEGGARGADRYGRQWAVARGYAFCTFPALWHRYGRAAGGSRNQDMVDSGADRVEAFPMPESTGTYDCLRRARSARIPCTVHDYTKDTTPDDQGTLF